mmetsp:Transcript_19477/g.42618  ORF Transcript_19477/g.42618 Transcript_19477/m.42618 type:complete len:199 (-) Transcript_19477:59-655(-)
MECINVKAGYSWPFSDRDFVVCNIFDTKPLEPDKHHPLFVSKSIHHPKCPENDDFVRGLSTFAVQTEKITDERCKLHILHFMHMNGHVPMMYANHENISNFVQDLVGRLRKHLQKGKPPQRTQPAPPRATPQPAPETATPHEPQTNGGSTDKENAANNENDRNGGEDQSWKSKIYIGPKLGEKEDSKKMRGCFPGPDM